MEGAVAGKVDISIAAQAERAGASAQEGGGMVQALRHKPHGVMAVLVPSILPPPAPFKIFILLAGVVGISASRLAKWAYRVGRETPARAAIRSRLAAGSSAIVSTAGVEKG